jgi:phosphoglycerate dehydrogenase-like enzyme
LEYLDELLSISDHIVVALPYTNQTKGLIDVGRLTKIKKGAFLYNVSRGGIIDEAGLMDCVIKKQLGGVALDVFETEPLQPESPWWKMENVVITPHIAGHYNGLREATFKLFRENLKLFLQGKPMRNIIELTL